MHQTLSNFFLKIRKDEAREKEAIKKKEVKEKQIEVIEYLIPNIRKQKIPFGKNLMIKY